MTMHTYVQVCIFVYYFIYFDAVSIRVMKAGGYGKVCREGRHHLPSILQILEYPYSWFFFIPVLPDLLTFNSFPLILKRVKVHLRVFSFKKAIKRNTTLKLMEHINFQNIAFSYFLIRLCGFK